MWKPDQISLDRIKEAHPACRQQMLDAYLESVDALKTGRATVRLPYVRRTFKEQDELFALGRSKVNPDGKKPSRPLGFTVTKARGGQSIHNYDLACDFCLMVDTDGNGTIDEASWNMNTDLDRDLIPDWLEVVRIFKKHQFEWGGDWIGFKDPPHFQMDFGYKWQDLLALKNAGKVDAQGYVLINT